MTRSRRARIWAAVLIAVLIAGAAGMTLLARSGAGRLPTRAGADRPALMLLTSLPLVFPERLSLDDGGSRTLDALDSRYRVIPIAIADRDSLKQGNILLMAHARAQPAENLVELDRWVRNGGRLLLLADPMLEWESERAIGDPLRPSPMFPDTGLLAHWGLRLDTPEVRGPAMRLVAGRKIVTMSPGALFGERCRITSDRLVADCKIGKGRATVVADADLLDVERLPGASQQNLDSLLALLALLEE